MAQKIFILITLFALENCQIQAAAISLLAISSFLSGLPVSTPAPSNGLP